MDPSPLTVCTEIPIKPTDDLNHLTPNNVSNLIRQTLLFSDKLDQGLGLLIEWK